MKITHPQNTWLRLADEVNLNKKKHRINILNWIPPTVRPETAKQWRDEMVTEYFNTKYWYDIFYINFVYNIPGRLNLSKNIFSTLSVISILRK